MAGSGEKQKFPFSLPLSLSSICIHSVFPGFPTHIQLGGLAECCELPSGSR